MNCPSQRWAARFWNGWDIRLPFAQAVWRLWNCFALNPMVSIAYKPIVKADLAKTVRKVLDEAKR
jgi:hypothetical protein